MSGHRGKASERGTPTSWRSQRNKSGPRKKESKQRTLTSWRAQEGDKSGNENKAKQARDTHKLEGAVETSQDTKRKRASEGHSLPGKHIERTSQHTGKKRASRVHPLPGEHKVGQVRTRSESEGIRGTHGLKSAEGRISQDTEKASEGHAQT